MGEIPIEVKLNFIHADGFLDKYSIQQLRNSEGPKLLLGAPICPNNTATNNNICIFCT